MANADSILNSTKQLSGIDESYDAFDLNIITYINSIFLSLNQMGVGPKKIFFITGSDETWADFEEGNDDLRSVRSYIAQKVRMEFDTSTSATVVQALKDSIAETEWRLIHQVETARNL